MNVSSGVNYNLRSSPSPGESVQQRKVEALTPPGIEPPIKSRGLEAKSVQSPDREKSKSKESSAQEERVQNKDQDKTQDKTTLSSEERTKVESLVKRDREVRAHESAHLSAAGDLAKSGADFEYTNGPDGRRYATGGEVSIDTSKAETPEETVVKAQRIRAAALAPAKPSAQDHRVSSKASQLAVEARADSQQQRIDEENEKVEEQSEKTVNTVRGAESTEKSGVTGSVDKSVVGKGNVKNSDNGVELQGQSEVDKQQTLVANNRASEYSDLTKDSGAGRIFNLVA